MVSFVDDVDDDPVEVETLSDNAAADDDDDDDDDDDNNNEAVIVRRRRALIALPNALYALILFLVCGENNNENIYPFQWCVEK
jgi:hypothetical protein